VTCLKRSHFLCPKGDLLIQVWMYILWHKTKEQNIENQLILTSSNKKSSFITSSFLSMTHLIDLTFFYAFQSISFLLFRQTLNLP
jgi:hypothetical protein